MKRHVRITHAVRAVHAVHAVHTVHAAHVDCIKYMWTPFSTCSTRSSCLDVSLIQACLFYNVAFMFENNDEQDQYS